MIGSQRQINSQILSNSPTYLSTNEVILHTHRNGDITYYLPCYLRFLLKEIEQVNTAQLEAVVTGTLLFSFYYGNMERQFVEQFIGEGAKAIMLEFNQEEAILLREDKGITMKYDIRQKIVDFIIRKSFHTNLNGDVFLTPFEILDMHILVTVQTIHLRRNENKIDIKFNCMNSNKVDVLGHGEQLSFGYYRIASYYMETKYSDSRKNPFKPISYFESEEGDDEIIPTQQTEEDFIQCYQYAHFRIPIYKYPAVSILTIFIPIWILGLIGLIVFFQQPGLGARLATIAVLALAFVAFIPTINESIPKSPNVKLVDILILMHLGAIILLIIQSYNVRLQRADSFVFEWNQSTLFIISLVMNASTFATVIILFIVYKCCWERKYNKHHITINKKYKKLDRKNWRNRECDLVFSKFASLNKVKIL